MSENSVIWEDNALKLLEERDRYTRTAIRDEFRRDPRKGAIAFDMAERNFLTPVFDGRFSVIWHLDDQRRVVVRAVVALTNISLDVTTTRNEAERDKLKQYVQRAVSIESKGEIRIP